MLLAEFGTGQVFWSMLYFFMFFIWVWLLISIFGDIFRSPDLSGWGKAAWSIFVIALPFIGIFTYLIARGRKMTEHAIDERNAQEEAFRSLVRSEVSSGTSEVDQLAKLATLKAEGAINDAEYAQMKAKVMAA